MTDRAPLVRLHGASFGYTDRPVVSGVDLELHAREVVALLGPNGSGKSTLVRGILGLTAQQGGEVELFGTPRDRFTEHTRIGYVPQRHSLSASVRATVTEIVEVGRLPAPAVVEARDPRGPGHRPRGDRRRRPRRPGARGGRVALRWAAAPRAHRPGPRRAPRAARHGRADRRRRPRQPGGARRRAAPPRRPRHLDAHRHARARRARGRREPHRLPRLRARRLRRRPRRVRRARGRPLRRLGPPPRRPRNARRPRHRGRTARPRLRGGWRRERAARPRLHAAGAARRPARRLRRTAGRCLPRPAPDVAHR